MGEIRNGGSGSSQLQWVRLAPIALSTIFWIGMLAAAVVVVRART